MEAIYNIPIKYKEGIYGVSELNVDDENSIKVIHSDCGNIVTYKVPDIEYDNEVRLYGIAKDVLDSTLKATYDTNKHLKTLTINKNNKEKLLYIYYAEEGDTRRIRRLVIVMVTILRRYFLEIMTG